MKRKDVLMRAVAACVVVALGALLAVKLNTQLIDWFAAAAVKSAGSFLPTPVTTVVPEPNVSDGADNADLIAAVTATETTAVTEPASTDAAATTVATTAASAREALTDLTATPQDILDRMAAALQTADRDKKDGAISEKQYVSEGVTDKAGVVRVKNTNDTKIDVAALLKEQADLKVKTDAPSVLIFHTHTTETYQILERSFYAQGFASRSRDAGRNMVRIGDEICAQLEAAGISVLHDTVIHDGKYTGAYAHSRKTVEEYLEKYPSIQVVLDIHRDAIQLNNGTKIAPTATVNGKKAAQVMIISGCQEEGNGVEDFPDWKLNLIFALQLQQQMETLFPNLTRPLFFCPRRYNMNVTHCSLLIEVGSDGNTLEEAAYSGRCVGKALAELMNNYKEH